MQGLNLSQPGLKHDPHWFRTAVFYAVPEQLKYAIGVGIGLFITIIGFLACSAIGATASASGVSPNPADGSVWGSVLGFPGGVARFDPATKPRRDPTPACCRPPCR